MNNNYNENNSYNQNMNNNKQYNQQYNQQYNPNNYNYAQGIPVNNTLDQVDKTKLTIAGLLLVVGWFFAGIICGSYAIILCNQVNKKSKIKTIISIGGILEVIVVVLYLILTIVEKI